MTESNAKKLTDLDVELLVVGGGIVGLTAAISLAGCGLSVAVVDRLSPGTQQQERYDGRASAIALGSWRVLDAIGLGAHLQDDIQPILDIRVVDGRVSGGVSPLFLHFDHREIGEGPLGYMVENRKLRRALFKVAEGLDTLLLLAPNTVQNVRRNAQGILAVLDDERQITARLIIAADGRNSEMRRLAGIRSRESIYTQTAIVTTVEHERSHEGVAVEQFLPSGPFAMLPMTGNRSSIVWTERPSLAATYLALSDVAFCDELGRRFGRWLGSIMIKGPRFSHPLGLMQAERYTAHRLVLVGDAAHVIHPIAGQGLNLGLRDVAALAEVIVDSYRLGLDVGVTPFLGQYERWRRFDNTVFAIATDGLNRLFSNDFDLLRISRDVGLAAVGQLPPLRRLLMRQAMGILGDLPRLLRGKPL